jgi:hypothetical protein
MCASCMGVGISLLEEASLSVSLLPGWGTVSVEEWERQGEGGVGITGLRLHMN